MQDHSTHSRHGYALFALELAVDFAIMYLIMYTMIATLDHFRLNLNNVYMTLMMVTPMALVMLIAMRSMFPSRRLNMAIGIVAIMLFAAAFWAMREQIAIGDREFLRSMIPHHSGAILMCREASLTDPEILRLCDQIIASQRAEIELMEAMLERM